MSRSPLPKLPQDSTVESGRLSRARERTPPRPVTHTNSTHGLAAGFHSSGRNVVDAGSYYSLIRMKGCAKNQCRILPFRTDSRQRRSAILFHNGTPAIVKARGGTFRGRKEWHSFISSKVEPKSYSEAVTHACWKSAVQEELQALVQKKSILSLKDLVSLPSSAT